MRRLGESKEQTQVARQEGAWKICWSDYDIYILKDFQQVLKVAKVIL